MYGLSEAAASDGVTGGLEMYMLEKLWRGELTPNEKIMRKGGPYHQKLGELCEIGDRLAEELSLEGKNLLQSYADAQLELDRKSVV